MVDSKERQNLDFLFTSALQEVIQVRLSETPPDRPEVLNSWQSATWFAREAAHSKLPREMAAAAARLFPTLMFGLRLLHQMRPRNYLLPELENVALTLSCLVLDAAADHYLHLSNRHRYAAQRELAWKIYCKLQEKPGSSRDLVRRSHNLRTDDVNDALGWLRSIGLVTHHDGTWRTNDSVSNPREAIANSIPNHHVLSNETLG